MAPTGDTFTTENKQKNLIFRWKIVLAICLATLVLIVSLLSLRPILTDFLKSGDAQQDTSAALPEGPAVIEEKKNDRKQKEYRFSQAQIDRATAELLQPKEKKSAVPLAADGQKSLYEIEFISGGRIYTEKVKATDSMITFENERGLVVSVEKNEVKTIKRLAVKAREQGANTRHPILR